MHRHSPIIPDVAWSVCLSECLLVITNSYAKMAAEPIEMPFGVSTWVGPRNHVLCRGLGLPKLTSNFGGHILAHCEAQGISIGNMRRSYLPGGDSEVPFAVSTVATS